MSTRFVALNDVLGALEQAGPLSSDALARQLRLNRLDARLVLVDAHAHGLVRTNSQGDWAITDLGREALTVDFAAGRGADRHQQGWSGTNMRRLRAFWADARWREVLRPRYLARRGLPLALGTIVCAGGVAFASSRLESSSAGPVIPTTKVKAAHGRHTRAREARHLTGSTVIPLRHHRQSTLVSTAGVTPRLTGHLVRQSTLRPVPQCRQGRVASGAGTVLTGSCTSARRGRLHSTTGRSGSGSSPRSPLDAGSGGSGVGLAVPPTASR